MGDTGAGIMRACHGPTASVSRALFHGRMSGLPGSYNGIATAGRSRS